MSRLSECFYNCGDSNNLSSSSFYLLVLELIRLNYRVKNEELNSSIIVNDHIFKQNVKNIQFPDNVHRTWKGAARAKEGVLQNRHTVFSIFEVVWPYS